MLSEGPGYGNCESSGSTGPFAESMKVWKVFVESSGASDRENLQFSFVRSLCYLPILVARQYSRSCTPPVFVKLLFQMSSCHLEVQRLLAKESFSLIHPYSSQSSVNTAA